MAAGQPGDTAGVSLEGPYGDEGKHWAGGTVLQHQMMEQLKQTSPRRSRGAHRDTHRATDPAGALLLHVSQFIQTFLQQDSVRVTGAAPQPKSVPMFRTFFHPHPAEEDPSSADTGGSQEQGHYG